MRLFDAATSVPALTEAWIRTLKNGGGPGGDGETLEHFARAAEFRLARLSHELQADLYRPGPLRRVQVPKRVGGMRQLSIPCVVDRIAQRAATSVLTAALEPQFSDSSFGYREGRSVQQAVARVDHLRRRGFTWVVDADIKGFFDNVPHAPLLRRLRESGVDQPLTELVGLWLDSFSDRGVGLAQGSPLSPVLANLHLDALDDSFGERGPVRIVRFADDFVLLTRHRPGAEAALTRAQERLAEAGLQLNLAKTRIVPFDQALRFLGHLFVGGTVLPSAENEPQARALTYAGTAEDADEAAARTALDGAPLPPVDDPTPVIAPEDQEADELSPGKVPLYLFEAGYRLVADREGFAVTGAGRAHLRLPAALVSRIDLGAEAEADDAALRLAATHGIPVALLNEAGLPQSVLMPALTGDAGLHMAQARLALDPARAETVAAILVAGRLRNAHALLKRLNRRRNDASVEAACTVLHYGWRKLEAPRPVEQARAVEAECARAYWPALSACFEHGFSFVSRRDPDRATPVNAVLDYTAALLIRDMRSAVLRARLHPGFGVLHASADGREACVYDLVEPFRAPLAEGLTVYLLNNRVLRQDDFVREAPGSIRSHGVRLLPAAARKLVQAYESWMARSILDPAAGRRTTWRSLLLTEARRFARMAEDGTPWTPYRMKH